jgi:hypothetical protein
LVGAAGSLLQILFRGNRRHFFRNGTDTGVNCETVTSIP